MHDVNLLAVLVAGIVPMIVGMLWYGPLFGNRWLTPMETTPEEIRAGGIRLTEIRRPAPP